jgi:hypothetical protein
MRRKLQAAYGQPTYEQAKTALKKLRSEPATINLSAVASLDEGFDETLTLHQLGLFAELGVSFKTTNCLESINGLVEDRCPSPHGERGIRTVSRSSAMLRPLPPTELRRKTATRGDTPGARRPPGSRCRP